MGSNVSTAYDQSQSWPTQTYETPPFQPAPSPSPAKKNGQVIAFHSSSKWKLHLEAVKQTSKLIVVDFTASWCGPCKQIEPAIHEFAEKYTDVDFIKIDVDELEEVAEEYVVQAMPTFILMKRGKEVDKIVGAKKDDLLKKIDKHRF